VLLQVVGDVTDSHPVDARTALIGFHSSQCFFHGIERPISDKTVWNVCRAAATRAGIQKKLGPHTLRHCFATHLLEAGADLRTIQLLMGHERLEDTTIYLHLSQRHLHAAINPLDQLTLRTAQEQRQR
jgi:site-specific recombinase XerD